MLLGRGSFAVFAAQDDTFDDVYARPPMKYYRGWQFVPMKGNAAMYYETGDDGSVSRFMTVIEGSGEIEKMPNPPMKRLFRPELLEQVSAEEFEKWWATTR